MQIALDRRRMDCVFFFCSILTVISPAIFYHMQLAFFAPALIIACYKFPLKKCLWLAFASGLLIDLFSSYSHFGLYSLTYCLTLILLYPQRRNFFADNLSTLPIMTFLFSLISTGILGLLFYSMEMKNVFSWKWAYTDLLFMPAMDGIYAYMLFIFPALFFGRKRRRSKEYFLSH